MQSAMSPTRTFQEEEEEKPLPRSTRMPPCLPKAPKITKIDDDSPCNAAGYHPVPFRWWYLALTLSCICALCLLLEFSFSKLPQVDNRRVISVRNNGNPLDEASKEAILALPSSPQSDKEDSIPSPTQTVAATRTGYRARRHMQTRDVNETTTTTRVVGLPFSNTTIVDGNIIVNASSLVGKENRTATNNY
jgi:hypothetical protein